MSYDVIIVGAGPGGLACAAITAAHGLRTLVLERKSTIGKKVCAGGVTWNGLVRRVPEHIFERQFPTQHIVTRLQKTSVSAPTPIIATVNRQNLGRTMSQAAMEAGAEIRPGCRLTSIAGNRVSFIDQSKDQRGQETFRFLVGADGSTSLVRRHLGLPAQAMGIGINYQVPGHYPRMEWHLDSRRFLSGYAWIFPHRETISVGAYADARVMRGKQLKENLLQWSETFNISLGACRGEAEFINFDYRGYRFDNIFLVGDAAGLASGLTGEGIYPAIVSGEAVARQIIDSRYAAVELQKMIKNHTLHSRMVALLGKSRFISAFFAELVTFCLKKNLVDFSSIEMAH